MHCVPDVTWIKTFQDQNMEKMGMGHKEKAT